VTDGFIGAAGAAGVRAVTGSRVSNGPIGILFGTLEVRRS
jgi:hypothetical protein